MALKLAGRNPAKFEFDDGVSQTTVTIAPADEPDVVRAKLQRVLELEGGRPAGAGVVDALLAMRQQAPTFTPADRAATDERLKGAQAMGWNASVEDGIDDLPEFS